MIACLDVHYDGDLAHAAAVVFADWTSTATVAQYTATVSVPAEYEPGRFYLRELPPLLAVIKNIVQHIDTYVIDGYCHLSPDMAPRLGAHLKESVAPAATIIGVAKNRYRDSGHAFELLRGQSKRALFITAIGIDYKSAAQHVASMAGDSRIPTLLHAVDRLSRGGR